MKTENKVCGVCHQRIKNLGSDNAEGYGLDSDGMVVCYACCAERDKQQMRATGNATLYLNHDHGPISVQNWPGSLVIQVHKRKQSRHNIARVRYDVWFRFAGYIWHGVQYGDNTQLCHCKRTKQSA